MKVYSRMITATKFDKARQFEAQLGKNLAAIAAAKDRMQQLEQENEGLAGENEELR